MNHEFWAAGAVLERRQQIEALPIFPWRLNGGIGVAIGIATAPNLFTPVLSYAFFATGDMPSFLLRWLLKTKSTDRAFVS